MGDAEEAAAFAASHPAPFPLLVDPERVSYRAVEMSRGTWMDVAGPKEWVGGIRATAAHGIAVARQDPQQLGGAAVLAHGGEVRLVHRSSSSSDNLPVDRLLEALA